MNSPVLYWVCSLAYFGVLISFLINMILYVINRFCEERKLLRSVIVTIGLNIEFFEEEAYLSLEGKIRD